MASPSFWRHAPKPEDRVQRQALQIVRGGRRWSGSWTVEHDRLFVESAYGSRTATAGRERGRPARAEALLGEIVDMRVRP